MTITHPPETIILTTDRFGGLEVQFRHVVDGQITYLLRVIDGPNIGEKGPLTALQIGYKLNSPEGKAAIDAASHILPTLTLTESGQIAFMHTGPIQGIKPLSIPPIKRPPG